MLVSSLILFQSLSQSFFFCLQGKTFSAEATSELVRRPLYVVGGGDLGTEAAGLDMALQKILDVATAWKAIVLIDEVASLPLTKYCFTDNF